MYNLTEDAHPIHIHLVQFQVVGREAIDGGPSVAGSSRRPDRARSPLFYLPHCIANRSNYVRGRGTAPAAAKTIVRSVPDRHGEQ